MITVAGFNTSIDRWIALDTLVPGSVRRAAAVEVAPGGKGLHVAQMVAALGERVQLVGLVDPAHRNLVARRMAERGVLFHGVEFEGPLRSCIAIREGNGRTTEILDPGQELARDVRVQLLQTLGRCAEESRLLVLSGSLPRGFATDTYAQLVRQARAAGVPALVDASGEALRQALAAAPQVLKPNREEAAELAGRAVQGIEDALAAARELHARGVAWPVITLGPLGAVGFDGDHAWHASLVLEHEANAVGSGDCLLAGLTVALQRGAGMGEALRLGVASGAANAIERETGYARHERVLELEPQVKVRRMDG